MLKPDRSAANVAPGPTIDLRHVCSDSWAVAVGCTCSIINLNKTASHRLDVDFGLRSSAAAPPQHAYSTVKQLTPHRPIFSESELTFTFAMSSSVRLSPVVCNVRAPYSGN